MKASFESIAHAFDDICLRHPENPGLIFDEETITYQELHQTVTNLAGNLQQLGVGKDDRVAIILPNCKEYIFSYFAIFKLGAWAMPVNTRWEADEISHVFDDAEPCTVILTEQEGVINFLSIIDAIRQRVTYLKQVILVGSPSQSVDYEGVIEFDALLNAPETTPRFGDVSLHDVAMLSYTSGTTGQPKGVMISHLNFIETSVHTAQLWHLTEEVPLSIAPLYAAQGFLAMLIDFIGGGATMNFVSTFNPNDILKSISLGRNTALHTQPTMWSLLLASRAINFANFSSLQKVVVSGSLCSSHLAHSIQERVGCVLLNAYGLVEATSVVTLTRPEDSLEVRLNTVGRPLPGVEIKIVDQQRQPVPKGEVGELAVKGYLMTGYYKKPEKTSEVIDEDGWLYTGDMARYYDDENISIVGRCKEMIIRGGFNIYPIDIEEVILKHRDVQDVAVVGRPHDVIGEQTVAFVVPHPGRTVTKNDILNFCQGTIANYKIPDEVIFISQMPIILSGKVKKTTLGRWAKEGVPRNELFLFE
ncbi:hypothetical protein CSB45_01825 [candidate division KSB3 bacterium]|uniref:Long-chain fatty acid--CoA ligase n=1 Tax=candidate division KSB3 bacterium TaxID=2044937 RepID=A0A2G6EAS1_9BACT|nr:MAG: hypothetical protein CSB45_01825 [candidate division KSB3 bacterium]